jgi:hypothetical protein
VEGGISGLVTVVPPPPGVTDLIQVREPPRPSFNVAEKVTCPPTQRFVVGNEYISHEG